MKMKTPEEILRDNEPGNDEKNRNNRRNELNKVRARVSQWLKIFDERPNKGPYRNEMVSAVNDLIEMLEKIHPDC